MIVVQAKNPRDFMEQIRSRYPEKPINRYSKLRPGWYALIESEADKHVIRKITNWSARDARRVNHG